MLPRGSLVLLTWLALLATLAPAAVAKPTMEIVDAPEVVVTNPSENMTQDNFNPDYVFTATARITNDGDERQINAGTIFYTDGDVQGCPQDERAFPVAFVIKNRKLSPDQQLTIGGAAHPSDGRGDAYWPMALSEKYQDANTGETVEITPGEHTFCTTIRVSGEDPACDKPANRTCVIATDSFRSYVRLSNQAPEITTFEISPADPRPGQEVLFKAGASDADTEPEPDQLRFTWTLGGDEKTGKTVRHSFDVATDHRVTLTVTDGFDTVTRQTTVTVATDGGGGDGDGGNAAPGLGAAAAVLLAGAVALVRRRGA